ncbi:MAG TPA: hypothetical protein VNU94_03220 [Acidobacteriaceae bacterium]|jgi:hypothetical protein|nr:hypothetical protein [Acidobacteriaceae bacterium]
MRRMLALCVCLLLATTSLYAESKDPANYPLRVHVFSYSETTFYHREYLDEAKGEGRANLFENSEAHGVDFSFECDQKLKTSFGYETYPAKWKKPGKELTVLLPVFGKTGDYVACTFKTDVKDFAYASHKDGLGQESVDDYKAWMVRTGYDPEHGKNVPMRSAKKDDSDPAAASH